MSIGKLVASPELRANLDAWLARFAAPGACNPDNENTCAADEPDTAGVGLLSGSMTRSTRWLAVNWAIRNSGSTTDCR